MNTKKWLQNDYVKRALFALAVVAGSGIIVLLLMNMQTIVGAITKFLGWVFSIMSGFVAGFVVAYLLLSVVVRLQKLIMKIPPFADKPRAARGLSVAATYLLIFVVFFGVLFALAVAITKQVQTINFADLPRLVQELEVQVLGFVNTLIEALKKFGIATEGMEEWLSSLGDNISSSLATMGVGFFSFANNVKSFVANAVFAVIFSIYFLYDTEGLMNYWGRAFHALLGKKAHGVLAVLLHDADACFSGYIRGQFADAVFMAVAVSILLSLAGVPYAIVIGILSGIGNLIPYVGPFVAYGLTIGVCVASGLWSTLTVALILVFILQTIDGNVINPRLLSQSIDVHPVLVIVGLLFGSAAGGFAGMLLAVPVASFLKIQFERLVEWRRRR